MSEFLLEIFTEEIPARMQIRAQDDLKRLLKDNLSQKGLPFEDVQTYVTPRRLVACVTGLPLESKATAEERRGPRLEAPEKALEGFLRSTGFTKEKCEQRDGYWYAMITKPAQQTAEMLPVIVQEIVRSFSWPKSMRWPGATISWVRPVRSVMTVFDGKPIVFNLAELGLQTGNITYGHRFLKPEAITVTSFAHYKEALEKAFVLLDHEARQKSILSQLQAHSDELEEDVGLLEEVAGLNEYPTVYIGKIKDQFMSLPKSVLSTSMRVHQKYFTFVKKEGTIAPVFGLVSNTIPSDDGRLMVEGYERVLQARLSDAAFFYEQDCDVPLVTHLPRLEKIVFHAKLGSVGQKVQRLQELVETDKAKRAAVLCKTDLVTSMVGEFPELQGAMGAIYAKAQGEMEEVAIAIEEHYQPQGPSDKCPSSATSVALSMADKIDTLTGFFAIGETPTGSKDPFALRRAALGLIRLIRENDLRDFDLQALIEKAFSLYQEQGLKADFDVQTVSDFIQERLAHALKQEGVRHDCVTAVIAAQKPGASLNIWALAERAKALDDFLKTEAGDSLQAAFKRAHGILSGAAGAFSYNSATLTEQSEIQLHQEIADVVQKREGLLFRHAYKELMDLLAHLRKPVDAFFELRINDDDPAIRANRMGLLGYLVQQTAIIADFNKLEG